MASVKLYLSAGAWERQLAAACGLGREYSLDEAYALVLGWAAGYVSA
jgi:hypothetical protein